MIWKLWAATLGLIALVYIIPVPNHPWALHVAGLGITNWDVVRGGAAWSIIIISIAAAVYMVQGVAPDEKSASASGNKEKEGGKA